MDAIEAARSAISGFALRTPLIRLPLEQSPAEIHLKLENLQPIGSFKIRGAANALVGVPRSELERGVFTASAGNMAQGVAFVARQLGVPCTVVVPDHAPRVKIEAIQRLGARSVAVPFADWWRVLETREFPGVDGVFVHPVSDPAVMAGNGTIGLEILEDLPDVSAVIVPYGGGGLATGVASALRGRCADAKVFATEVETAAPLAASFAAGQPVEVDYTASFVDGMGGRSLLPGMWPVVRELLDDSIVVSLDQIAEAIRTLMFRARIVAEGAGAAPLAAALTGAAGSGKVVCVVSGGNIDPERIAEILAG